MAIDLVCHMKVDETNSTISKIIYLGKHYYFCTPLCMVQFKSDPDKYIQDFAQGKHNRIHKGKGNPLK